jgi:hypothetical protein
MNTAVSYLLVIFGALFVIVLVISSRRRLLAFLGRFQVRLSGFKGKTTDATGRDVKHADDSSAQLLAEFQLLNENLQALFDAISRGHADDIRQKKDLEALLESYLLRLLESQQSFANSLGASLQRTAALMASSFASGNSIREHAATDETASEETVYLADISRRSSIGRTGTTADSTAAFEDFIQTNKKLIDEASYEGIGNIRSLLSQINSQHSVEIDCPSEQVFILLNRNAKSGALGKAFVLPGKYLGRPWVDWFDMPKGTFERIELTQEPATVSQDNQGAWQLVRKGKVIQH